MESLSFMEACDVRALCDTPAYVYDLDVLQQRANILKSIPHAYGFQLRFAMKSNPSIAVMSTIRAIGGIHIDASSVHEVRRALRYGFAPSEIQLTSQYPAKDADLKELIFEKGVLYNACSLLQLRNFCRLAIAHNASSASTASATSRHVTVRVNPGLGSGSTSRTNVGGPGSSFGVWFEHMEEARAIVAATGGAVAISGLHSHIGSGTDVTVWERAADLTLAIARDLPDLTTVSLGGGFKVDRMRPGGDSGLNMEDVGQRIKRRFEAFHEATGGRKLKLELEPGTFFVAMCGYVVSTVIDVVDTLPKAAVPDADAAKGFVFAKLDAGMNEVLRPSLYGAQHPIALLPMAGSAGTEPCDVVFVGPCCESGDILTPAPGDPEGLLPRRVAQRPAPGDIAVIGGCGAYCSSMATTNYNSYPAAPEAAIWTLNGKRSLAVVRKRQSLDQVLENEVTSFA